MQAAAQANDIAMNEKRFPASEAHRLDNPARAEWLASSDVLSALNLHAGQTVADVGAGTGYLSLPFAQCVGLKGKVYAVDAQAGMLSILQQKIDRSHLSNVILIQAEAHQSGLPASCCGLFFMANVWHEIEDKNAVLGEAMRVLEPGDRIAILDWRPDVEPEHGPPLADRVDVSRAMENLRSAGFELVVSSEVGRYSWLVQGEKPQ
jgi:ubiquinone/menaquinone biosynthesis C-methylase UbiE